MYGWPPTFGLLNSPPKCFFITLTYSEPKKLFNTFVNDVVEIMKWLNNAGKYKLVSELSPKGAFHWHVMIDVNDEIKLTKFLNHWAYHKGFVDRKKVDNKLGMFIYLRKQSFDMSEELSKKFNIEQCSSLAIITNSTSPLIMELISDYLKKQKVTNKNIKKLNNINVGILKYYKSSPSNSI